VRANVIDDQRVADAGAGHGDDVVDGGTPRRQWTGQARFDLRPVAGLDFVEATADGSAGDSPQAGAD
jgi:hypothetical protein